MSKRTYADGSTDEETDAEFAAKVETSDSPTARRIEELERENAELREDKARLDLLDRNAAVRDRTLAIMERGSDHEPIRWAGIEWDGRETTIRQEIDFHRNR